jgi:chromate reductase
MEGLLLYDSGVASDLHILAIAGSLRRGSCNRALVLAAIALAPAGMVVEPFDLAGIPLYNADDEDAPAERAVEFRRRVRAADGVLMATPEYNYAVSGVLKNAIDWASQPYGHNAWDAKPVAVMGASISSLGTARAQYQLRQTLTALNCYTLNQPEVLVGDAPEKFDAEGRLVDGKTRDDIARMLAAFAGWIRKIR